MLGPENLRKPSGKQYETREFKNELESKYIKPMLSLNYYLLEIAAKQKI